MIHTTQRPSRSPSTTHRPAASFRGVALRIVAFRLAALRVAVLASAALLLALAACGPSADAAERAATFRLPSLDGGEVSPADYEDRAVVVDFWATWCPPCHVQSDILEQAHAEWEGRAVQFLAVNVGEDEDTVREFLGDSPPPWPMLLDPEEELSWDLKLVGLPTVAVISPEGELVYLQAGVTDMDELDRILREEAGV